MKRIRMAMLVAAFVLGTTALVSTVAIAHGVGGMMGDLDNGVGQTPCQDDAHPGAIHHGYGQGMMGGMMGYQGMGSMMGGGYGGHMMNDNAMGHDGVLSQADKLGLSADQIDKLNVLRLTERKDIIRDSAEANIVHLELSNLLSTANWTMQEAEPLVKKLNKIEGDFQLRHLQTLNEASHILTADQQKLYSSIEKSAGGETYCD